MAPRRQPNTTRRWQLELDRHTLSRSATVVTKALEGGRQLSRPRLYERLERAGIVCKGRGLHILWRCAHDGLICFGAREGKQHTFALMDEWLPPAKALDPRHAEAARNGILGPTILLKGRAAGTWTRRLENGRVAVALTPFVPPSKASARAVAAAVDRYGRFLGRSVDIR
jgi:hypothetical protein